MYCELKKKKQNYRTSIDRCFAGPTLFLLVSGTGPPGYFEDCLSDETFGQVMLDMFLTLHTFLSVHLSFLFISY